MNSINFNLVCHTDYCGYMHDVTVTLCAPSIKMYTRINWPELPDTIILSGCWCVGILIGYNYYKVVMALACVYP